VVTKYVSILSHYFPYLYENYIILSPCHSRIVAGPKSYQVDVLCVDYPSHIKFHVVTKYFLTYPTTFLTCKIIISSWLLATVEVVDKPKSYKVYVLCIHYSSHQIVTCGYEVVFSLIPLLPLLFRELYLLVSLPQYK
jgi:hypothetical protein